MNKYIKLLKNIGLLTIGSFASKLMSFFLVPLYTNVLSTQEYGSFEIASTTVSLLLPILSINITESVCRFLIDEHIDSNRISKTFAVGVKYTFLGCVIMLLILIINGITQAVSIFLSYGIYIFFMYVVGALNQLLLNYAKGMNRIKEISISGVIASASMLILNLFFLLYLKLGLKGYFLAYLISIFAGVLYYIWKLNVIPYIKFKCYDKKFALEMTAYSFPLMFNTIGWWINNVSDRYIVAWMCGAAVNGIYSVAYKIPAILNTVHSIFMQVWEMSAVQEYSSDNSSSFFENIYNIYGGLVTIACSFLIVFTKPIASVLFKNDFYLAWQYSPLLMITVIFGTLSGVLGGVFSAEKKSNIFAISTCIGAAVNIVLNIILIRFFGAMGAAIASVISGYVVWFMRLSYTKKYIKLNLKLLRDHIAYFLLITQSILLCVINKNVTLYTVNVLILLLVIILYKNEINQIKDKFIYLIKKRIA